MTGGPRSTTAMMAVVAVSMFLPLGAGCSCAAISVGLDAQVEADAGNDAQSNTDTGAAMDAGADGGQLEDAFTPLDSASTMDADFDSGTGDASADLGYDTGLDASEPMDASLDASPPDPCEGRVCGPDASGGGSCGICQAPVPFCRPDGSACEAVPSGPAIIPAGSFIMGAPDDHFIRSPAFKPAHTVTITRAFAMDPTEVTQADWQALMGNNPSVSACGPTCPVESVSWYDALAYSNARSDAEARPRCYDLSACTGTPGTGTFTCPDDLTFSLDCTGYRLPTEAEWEYAYAATSRTAFYNGDITPVPYIDEPGPPYYYECTFDPVLDAIGWYCFNSGYALQPVARKLPNAFGLYDMSGNVGEWTWDHYDLYSDAAATDPVVSISPTPSMVMRVRRSSAFPQESPYCDVWSRLPLQPWTTGRSLGIRTVRTLDP